jgi:hypothetical protein
MPLSYLFIVFSRICQALAKLVELMEHPKKEEKEKEVNSEKNK